MLEHTRYGYAHMRGSSYFMRLAIAASKASGCSWADLVLC